MENRKRPRSEVNTLMTLLEGHPPRAQHSPQEQHTVPVIGRHEGQLDVQHELKRASGNRRQQRNAVQYRVNYGGRAEIVDAARRAIAAGVRPEDLDERRFWRFPIRPDSLIRTPHPHGGRCA
jgi:undecaprenyl diphosphate synthase